MKVNIYETVEISDEQRVQLAVALDDGKTKPKRQATRDEIKDFIWTHGAAWPIVLQDEFDEATGAAAEPEPEPEESDEDLLGTADDVDDEDLI